MNFVFYIFPLIAVLSLLGSIAILSYLGITERQAPKFLFLPEKEEEENGPSVSIIVTARNEELMIEDCLDSLVAQTYQRKEIIAVDDSSSDRTVEIISRIAAREPQLRLVNAGQKPIGWVGKSWPCWRGAEEAKGEYLLFVDADSQYERTLVSRSALYVKKNAIDIFSVSPRVKFRGIWARAVLPMITGAINLLYPMRKVNDKKSDRAYVFGTYFLIRKDVYEKTGGHREVRDQIVEDAAIARLVKSAGYKLRIERGENLLATEWESDARAIFNGLERVASSSIKSYGIFSILNAILLFFLIVYPLIFVVAALALHVESGLFLTGIIACVANIIVFLTLDALQMTVISGSAGGPAVLLYFIGGLFFIAAIVTTSVKVARGRDLYWKGQGYKQGLAIESGKAASS